MSAHPVDTAQDSAAGVSTAGRSAHSERSLTAPLKACYRKPANCRIRPGRAGSRRRELRLWSPPPGRRASTRSKRRDLDPVPAAVQAHPPRPHPPPPSIKSTSRGLSARGFRAHSCVGGPPAGAPWAGPDEGASASAPGPSSANLRPTRRTRGGPRRALFLGAARLPAERQISLRPTPALRARSRRLRH